MAIEAPRAFIEPPHGFVEPTISRESTWESTKPLPISSAKRAGSSDEGKKQRRMLPLFKSRPKSVEAVQQQQNRGANLTNGPPGESPMAHVQKEQAHDPASLTGLHIEVEQNTHRSRLNSASTTQSRIIEPDHPEYNAWADAESPQESHRSSGASGSSQSFPLTPESAENRYGPGLYSPQIMQNSPSRDSSWSQRSTRETHGSFGSAAFTNTNGTPASPVGPNGLPKGTPGDYFPLLQGQIVPSPAPVGHYQHHPGSTDRHTHNMGGGKSLLPGEHNKYAGFCKGMCELFL